MLKYKEIVMAADHLLHERVFELFLKESPSESANIIVLGSGNGAFEARLREHKYVNITSVDIEAKGNSTSRHLVQRNLNHDFSDLGKFDFIFAIELIEHLENQFHFLRECSKLMNEDSTLYITTPNITLRDGRIKFLFRSRLPWFDENAMHEFGHISPILEHIFRKAVGDAELNIDAHIFNRLSLDEYDLKERSPVRMMTAYCLKFFRAVLPGDDGVISIYKISKKLKRSLL
jgi:2-polyprenyl-3-methyl-5-hydroxy-6-metoxy-1,4-benzoquinol methylase